MAFLIISFSSKSELFSLSSKLELFSLSSKLELFSLSSKLELFSLSLVINILIYFAAILADLIGLCKSSSVTFESTLFAVDNSI